MARPLELASGAQVQSFVDVLRSRRGRRPADSYDNCIGECFPGVIYAWSPYEVIALALQGEAALGEVDPEFSANVEDQGRPFVVCGPFGAFVTCRVDSPFDFYVFA